MGPHRKIQLIKIEVWMIEVWLHLGGMLLSNNDNREIKHHVYGKCERQKYHMIIGFPPFFTFAVCHLLFLTWRGLLLHLSTTWVFLWSFWFVLLQLSAQCLSPVMFYLFFYANWPVYCQCLNKREEKGARKWGDVWLSPLQRLSSALCKKHSYYAVHQNIPRKPHLTNN